MWEKNGLAVENWLSQKNFFEKSKRITQFIHFSITSLSFIEIKVKIPVQAEPRNSENLVRLWRISPPTHLPIRHVLGVKNSPRHVRARAAHLSSNAELFQDRFRNDQKRLAVVWSSSSASSASAAVFAVAGGGGGRAAPQRRGLPLAPQAISQPNLDPVRAEEIPPSLWRKQEDASKRITTDTARSERWVTWSAPSKERWLSPNEHTCWPRYQQDSPTANQSQPLRALSLSSRTERLEISSRRSMAGASLRWGLGIKAKTGNIAKNIRLSIPVKLSPVLISTRPGDRTAMWHATAMYDTFVWGILFEQVWKLHN